MKRILIISTSLVLMVFITSIIFCSQKEVFEPVYECSIKAKVECRSDSNIFIYSIAFDRPERMIMECEFWIRQDEKTYCLAARASQWTNGNLVREIRNIEIIDTIYYKRMINCKDTSDLRLKIDAYEQSLNDYQNKYCSTTFFYIK